LVGRLVNALALHYFGDRRRYRLRFWIVQAATVTLTVIMIVGL
jgi:hypothetical protein